MSITDEISSTLNNIQFTSIYQYLDELLTAFRIPTSTISRLISSAKDNDFDEPIYLYRRAAIIYENGISKQIGEYEKILTQEYCLLLIITKNKVICKDKSRDEVVEFAPNQVADYLDFLAPIIFGSLREKDIKKTTNFVEIIASLFNQLSIDNNAEQEIFDYILTLIYLSFSESITKEAIFEKFFRLIFLSGENNYNNIIQNVFNASLSAEKQTNIYKSIPYYGTYKLTSNKLPSISKKSFEFSAKILSFELNEISPDILSSLIYKLTSKSENISIYGHHTTASNVEKVLKPLFINEFEKRIFNEGYEDGMLRSIKKELLELTFFDPTNGPGCFLSSAFTSVKQLLSSINEILGPTEPYEIRLSNFVGLVENDVAFKLSHLTLWVNYLQYLSSHSIVTRNDLKLVYESVNIQLGDQLKADWKKVCPNAGNILVIGSPQFKGSKKLSSLEKTKMQYVFGSNNLSDLDYSSAWLYKAADYIRGSSSKCAFVVTNSVCQGSQVSSLWTKIYEIGCEISFAHRSFKWKNSSKVSTGVSVIILGLIDKSFQPSEKLLYVDNKVIKTDLIGPYLINSTKVIVNGTNTPISPQLPEMQKGNMPYDNQHLLLSKEEKDSLLQDNPVISRYLKRIVGSKEFIDCVERWCIWISDEDFDEAMKINVINDRVKKVRNYRLSKTDIGARKLAERPHQFREFRSTTIQTLVVPSVSSENRPYIPIGFVGKSTVISNLAFAIYDCDPWIFGLVSSRMHMVWIRTVCGSLETRLRYSSRLGYNTFPFPIISDEKKHQIESLVFDIISERENYCDIGLGDLYNDLPAKLRILHEYLDAEIDSCYQQDLFSSDFERIRMLLNRYSEMKG